MAEVVSTNQFKNGMHIELDGSVWRIVEFQHVKPGKGGAFVRTKVKNLDSGSVVDRTFRAGEKFSRVHTEVKNVQYLYDSGDEVVFMDEETFEQFGLPRSGVEDELSFLQPSSTVQMLTVDGRPSGIQLPASVSRSTSHRGCRRAPVVAWKAVPSSPWSPACTFPASAVCALRTPWSSPPTARSP